MEMVVVRKPSDEDTPEARHAREVDALKAQCETCKLWKPKTPTKDCDIRRKLVKDDSPVAWKHRHLFLTGNKCKMYQVKR